MPLFASCTASEDTEPFVPAVEGATQPAGSGALLSEEDACAQLLDAASAAYDRLHCSSPSFPQCPGFLRAGGGSGCYEYFANSVEACVKAYEDAPSCRDLSPCLATAQLNEELATCERIDVVDMGGAGGMHDPGAGAMGGTAGGALGGAGGEGAAEPVAGAAGAGVAGQGGAPPIDSAGGAGG